MKERIGRWWRKLGQRKKADWPRMEQGQYRSYRAVHPFDERFGVDTSGLIYDLRSGHQHDLYNNGYFAVAPSVFHGILRAMQERLNLDFQSFRFVDLGSGKGRALMLASEYPFVEVVGVELSPELERVARTNLARYASPTRRRAPVTSVLGDATEYRWPSGPLIVYMWNSFTQPVLELVFENLAASLAGEPRELYLIYIHPELEMMLAELPWLLQLWREDFAMNDEDFTAWAFPEREEVCSVYQAIPEKVAFPRRTKVLRIR